MKKIMAISLLAAFTCTILTGCAEKDIPVENTENSSAISEADILSERGEKPADGYNTLQDIELITDKFIKNSSGFEKIDNLHTCGTWGTVTVPSGEGTLVLRDWNTTDLSSYLENGEITFWVKGENDTSDFEIVIQDCNRDRTGENDSVFISKNVSDYISITDDWQEVKIPLKDYFNDGNGLDITCIWTIRLKNAVGDVSISNMRIVSPDKEPTAAKIKVNQLGFRVHSEKYALVSGYYEELSCAAGTSFQLISAESGKAVYDGKLVLVEGYDAEYSGETVYKADFSNFTEKGEYYISVDAPGIENSYKFKVGGNIYDKLLGKVCKYYYFQRANTALTEEYAGKWAREAMYTEDFELSFLSDREKTADVSGGWFDAGDFGKYVDPGVAAVVDLMWAYISFPEVFTDGLADIPESGNGIPDILDEAKTELDFFLKMQDADGGVYHRVHPDDGTRAIVDTFSDDDGGNVKSTGTTAHTAGTFALASTVYKNFDNAYADTLMKAAVKAWEYACAYPDIGSGGAYSVSETDHQMFFAACCLYYALGEDEYHNYIKENYRKFDSAYKTETFGHNYSDMKKMAYIAYLASAERDAEITEWIETSFNSWKDEVLSIAASNPWNTPLPTRALLWGSNANAMCTGMEMYLTQKYLGTDTSDGEKLLSSMTNFILGINPSGKSIVTGVGENCIKRTYSGVFGTDEIEEFPHGYTSGGVNAYDAAIVSRFPLKCYSDTALDWVSNENAVYYQSAFIFGVAMQAAME